MERRSRVVAVTVMLATLGSGCATLQDTPAQALARERIDRCKRFPSVMPQEVRSDGAMTVLTYGPGSVSEYPAWRFCMEEALAEQKRNGRLPADAQPAIVDVRGR